MITTTNLWFRGEVPAIWRDKFPDNASFVNTQKLVTQ
jgi:hypothetical protein